MSRRGLAESFSTHTQVVFRVGLWNDIEAQICMPSSKVPGAMILSVSLRAYKLLFGAAFFFFFFYAPIHRDHDRFTHIEAIVWKT